MMYTECHRQGEVEQAGAASCNLPDTLKGQLACACAFLYLTSQCFLNCVPRRLLLPRACLCPRSLLRNRKEQWRRGLQA